MAYERFFLIAIPVLLTGVVAAITLLLVHAAVESVSDRREARRLKVARPAFVRCLAAEVPDEADLDLLRQMPMHTRVRLVLQVGRAVTGEERHQLRELSLKLDVATQVGTWSRATSWGKRLRAARVCTAMAGGDDVMAQLMTDLHPRVRSASLRWAAARCREPHDPEDAHEQALLDTLTARVVERLASGDLSEHLRAVDALILIGTRAVPHLAAALAAQGGQVVHGALRAAEAIGDPDLLAPAIGHLHDGDTEARVLAARVVGRLGAEKATGPLLDLLEDKDPEVRAAAAAALGKTRTLAAVAPLRDLLADPDWPVRRAAALALRDIGSPGLIALRRVSSDATVAPQAAGVARQVLDLVDLERARGPT